METTQQNNNYLINEPIRKLLPKFAIPCVISLIISCLYNIVDQIFVGQFVGVDGNAATGIIFPITVIGWGIALLFGDGAAAFLSLSHGRGDAKNVGKTIANSILFSFLIGALLIIICYSFGDSILYLLGATDETIALAHDYGFIIYIMIPLALVQATLGSIIRADGSPRYAMFAMAVGAVLNIAFDAITICVFHWGIKGAAIATIFGQFISFVLCVLYLRKSKTFRIRLSDLKPSLKAIKPIIPLGGSSFLTQLSIVIVTIVNNVLLVRYGAELNEAYGSTVALGAFVVIMKLFQIVLNIAIGIAAGAQPIISFNYGAKRYDRVKQTFKYVLLWTFIITAVATLLFELIPKVFIGMFGSAGSANAGVQIPPDFYMGFAVKCLRIYLSLIIFTCIQKACAIFLQSIGKAALAIPMAIIRDVVFLIVFSATFASVIGVEGVFWGAPAADILAIVITAAVMLFVWKKLDPSKVKGVSLTDTTLSDIKTIKPSKKGVIVTIAREHGSAGKYIGRLVAEKLGIPFYYKEMTALAAQESGLANEFISDINANSPHIMHELYLSTEVVQRAIIAQEKIIRKIADNGSCVIVGRAADYVLRDYKDVVRVFIHAPAAYRIKKVMEMYGDTEQEAKKSIARSDAARATYYKNISGLKWRDSDQYDLSIDSSIGAEKTAEAIVDYVSSVTLHS
ncbi:MAG: MATE family efflux transporter [Clostridiales bacterium]|jgi:putative MATE family efflux protein|nr:MATE family efflux transporter [Clostridiales bacterium]